MIEVTSGIRGPSGVGIGRVPTIVEVPSQLLACLLAIRVEHDAVSCFAGVETGEGFVDLAHWQVLGSGRHIMAGGELEHRAPALSMGEPVGEPEMLF